MAIFEDGCTPLSFHYLAPQTGLVVANAPNHKRINMAGIKRQILLIDDEPGLRQMLARQPRPSNSTSSTIRLSCIIPSPKKPTVPPT